MIDSHGEATPQPGAAFDWESQLGDLDVSDLEVDLVDEGAFANYILQTQQEADAAFKAYSEALTAVTSLTKELIAQQEQIDALGNVGDLPKVKAEMDAKREELARRLQRKDELFQEYLQYGQKVTNALNRPAPKDDGSSEP